MLFRTVFFIIFKFPLKILKLQFKFSEIKNKNKIDTAAKTMWAGRINYYFFYLA